MVTLEIHFKDEVILVSSSFLPFPVYDEFTRVCLIITLIDMNFMFLMRMHIQSNYF